MISRRSLLALPLVLAASGCAPPAPTADAPPPSAGGAATAPPSGASGGAPLKVALVTNGALTDSGWNSLAGDALEQMKSELSAETSHQSAGPAQGEEAIRGFARDGAKLVFAHGNEFGDAAKKVAAEFPNTYFAVSSGEVEAANLLSLRFDIGEAAYLAGMAAAALSKSGKAGQIGGESFPPVKQGFELFEKGAQAVNPKFTTTITYIGNWSDANSAKEKALSMIRAGADVLFQNADAAGEGVFQAAEENKDKGVLVIGSNRNQNDLKPEIIPASAVLDVAKTFMSVARSAQSGSFKGGVHLEDLKSGSVYLAINPKFEDRIPVDVKEKIRKAEEAIKSGELKLVQK